MTSKRVVTHRLSAPGLDEHRCSRKAGAQDTDGAFAWYSQGPGFNPQYPLPACLPSSLPPDKAGKTAQQRKMPGTPPPNDPNLVLTE